MKKTIVLFIIIFLNAFEQDVYADGSVNKSPGDKRLYSTFTLKNGIDVMVPPFIEDGDKIILDTRSLEYVKKINQ